jgi:hypothetical protein
VEGLIFFSMVGNAGLYWLYATVCVSVRVGHVPVRYGTVRDLRKRVVFGLPP